VPSYYLFKKLNYISNFISFILFILFFIPTLSFSDGSPPPTTYYDWATVKFDSKGQLKWAQKIDKINGKPENLALDQSGNIYIIAECSAIIKYDPYGNKIFTIDYGEDCFDYDGSHSTILVDNNNFFIILVDSSDQYYGTQISIEKYDPDGNIIWGDYLVEYPNNTELGDINSMVIDSTNNITIGGYGLKEFSDFVDSYFYYYIKKYNSEGKKLWIKNFLQTQNPELKKMALDDNDNIYLGGKDFIAKFDQNGNNLWVDQSIGSCYLIEINKNGDIFLGINQPHYQIIKLDTDGNKLWEKNISVFYYMSFKLDSKDNLIVMTALDGKIITYKYSPNYKLIWKREYEFSNNDFIPIASLAISKDDNIIIAATSINDYFIIQYDPDGNELWTARYDDTIKGNYYKTDMTVDPSGSIYITGYYYKGSGSINSNFSKTNHDQGSKDSNGCGCSMSSGVSDGSIFIFMLAIGLVALMWGKIVRRREALSRSALARSKGLPLF